MATTEDNGNFHHVQNDPHRCKIKLEKLISCCVTELLRKVSQRALSPSGKAGLNVLGSITFAYKGPVKLIQRVKIAHSFLVCVESVPHYDFKLVYVSLHMAIKKFFRSDF